MFMLKSRKISEIPQFSGSIDGNELVTVQKGSSTRKISLNEVYTSASLSSRVLELSSSIADNLVTQNPIFSDVSVGGVDVGQTLPAGLSIDELANRIFKRTFFPTFTPPSVSVVSSLSSTVEVGTVGLTITANFSAGSIVGNTVGGIWNLSAIQANRAGSISSYIIDGVNTGLVNNLNLPSRVISEGSNTFSATVNYNQGPQPLDSIGQPYLTPLSAGSSTNSVTVSGRRRAFFGVNSAATTSAQIRALSNSLLNPANNSNFTINIPSGSTSVVFSYPASLRDVTSVIYVEGLNADVKGVFNLTTVSVEGLSGFTPVNYKTYRFQPVTPFSSVATYIVTI